MQKVSDTKYRLAESPFYDPRTKKLTWVDILAGKLYMMDEDNKISSASFSCPIGAAVPAQKPGDYVICGQKMLCLFSNDEAVTVIKCVSDIYESFRRSNDAKADPAGRLWFGSSVNDSEHEPSGKLFCLEGGNITVKQDNTRISNGMAWNKDRTKFYFSDSLFHCIFEYDYDLKTGEISNRREFYRFTDGVPDGMCIDSEDCLWIAVWGGSRIERVDTRTGKLMSTLKVPAKNVTSCCFCGDDMKTLFITTSGDDLDGEGDGLVYFENVDVSGPAPDYVIL